MKKLLAHAAILCLVTAVGFAGGAREGRPANDADAPGAQLQVEMIAQTDTGETIARPVRDEPIPMDDETAELLFSIGMLPFENRIRVEDFTLLDLNDRNASLSDSEGKLVLLNFWATWCPPCREEMPSMQTLYDELGGDAFEIIAVNVLESREVAKEFIDEMGFTYPVLLDRDGRVMLRYGVRAYPTSYLIDAEGYIIGVRPGFHDWGTDEMIAGISALMPMDRARVPRDE